MPNPNSTRVAGTARPGVWMGMIFTYLFSIYRRKTEKRKSFYQIWEKVGGRAVIFHPYLEFLLVWFY